MVEEGFDELKVVSMILGQSQLLEDYPDDRRCLILGKLAEGRKTRFLHIVCDCSDSACVDVITAYIPQKPWWETPTRRAEKR